MANFSIYTEEEEKSYAADINIEVTIDISKYFDKEDFCEEGYTFVAPSGRVFYYGDTSRGIIPLITKSSVWFGTKSTKVEDAYYSADIASLAQDINAFYEYLEKEKENKLAADMNDTHTTKVTLTLRDVIPRDLKRTRLPLFISSNNIRFHYDTCHDIVPVISKYHIWFDAPEIADIIYEDEDTGIDEIYKGFEEYKNFLKGYFAAKAEKE